MGSQHLRCALPLCFVCILLIFPHLASAKFRDGVGVYGGFYGPLENSMDSIYGSGFRFGVRYQFAIHPDIKPDLGLATSIDVLQKRGDPYNDETFTVADSASRLTFVPIEISYIINLVSNKPEMGRRIRNLYIGVGANHIWARERAPGLPLAKGNAFGGQALAGADFFISRDLALAFELKYMRNRPLMKLDPGSDYRVELDGVQVQAMVMWNLGN